MKHRNGLRYPEVHHYRSRAVEEKRARKPELDWIPAFVAEEGYHILLSHHPEYYPLIPEGVDLCLSGHAHGGQWNIYNPFEKREDGGRGRWRGVFAPGQGLWPRYTSGVYMEPGLGRLIVSRGLANTAGVPRIFNPCEVVVVEGD